MIRRTLKFALVVVAACIAPAAAAAQSVDTVRADVSDSTIASTRASTPTPAAGPRLAVTATGVRHLTASPDAAAFQRAQPMSMGKPMALMIVGGAAIVLGAVMGTDVGTLFMIGGSVAVLIGLYQYLK